MMIVAYFICFIIYIIYILTAFVFNGCLSAEAAELLNAHLELQIPINDDNKKEPVAMCEAMRFVEQKYTEKGKKEGRKEGIKEGRAETLEEIIRNGLQKNVPYETIHQMTGCSLRKIRAIERAFGA